MDDLSSIYRNRFQGATGLDNRDRVWKILWAHFFKNLIYSDDIVLDLACGYGEFINNVQCKEKYAADLNADAKAHLNRDVTFLMTPATDLSFLKSESISVAFTSNFLEHLRSKDECTDVFLEVLRVLKPDGKFIIMGPNIKYAYREYWDFYDHHLPLSHLSLTEGLTSVGYDIDRVIKRFLPYTMVGKRPAPSVLIKGYLAMPLAWRLFGKQFLIVARKPSTRPH